MNKQRLDGFYTWIGNHIRSVAGVVLMVVIAIGVVGSQVANTDEPSFDAGGEVHEIYDEAEATLAQDSSVAVVSWITLASDGGNVLERDALIEWLERTEAARSAPEHAALVDRFDPDTATITPGISSFVDVIDGALPGGLVDATGAEVDAAIMSLLAPESPYAAFRETLSESAEVRDGRWTAPAFTTQVTFDRSQFEDNLAEEAWLRELQDDLREGASSIESYGIAVDFETTFEESSMQSAPFIFLAVAMIIVLIAFVHRSYWSAAVVGVGLAATSIGYYGTSALFGLQMGSLLLAFVVPIAMISFGVDFYIHGLGRVREMQVDGAPVSRAYPRGMTAVYTAMLLAVLSSVSAFLANAVSGTEAIIEFGFGAAFSLIWAYLLLGQIGPRVTVGLEKTVGSNPTLGLTRFVYRGGTVLMAVLGGLVVAVSALMPVAGIAALIVFLAIAVAGPVLFVRRRNRRAAVAGTAPAPSLGGVGHGFESAGFLVSFLARWRFVTLAIVAVLAVVGLNRATHVDSGFAISDFIPASTDAATSIALAEEHYPSAGEGTSFVFVTGDLTNPDNLAALDEITTHVDESDAEFGRRSSGELVVGLHAGDLVRMVAVSPAAERLGAAGFSMSDADGDGFPDSAVTIREIFRRLPEEGVLTPAGGIAVAADETQTIVAEHESGYATAVVVRLTSFFDADIVLPAESVLNEAASAYVEATEDTDARVSGDAIAEYHGVTSFTDSMLVSLPLALLMALMITMLVLRSVRYALVAVLPIGLVVIGVYAFMAMAGYTVNPVSATIAAIAVGVGIDFSTHFTARFREELVESGDRLTAARIAGAGTGSALVLSAVTSVLGFMVMSFAPAPIFATFGLLTAVMIALSLAVSILVVPSLLVLVSNDRNETEIVERDPVLVG